MNEEWRPVPGYEGIYEVSNMGRVKSLPRDYTQLNMYGTLSKRHIDGKVMRLHILNSGYCHVELTKGARQCKSHPIHRLVALAFIPNPKGLPFINHKDEDKQNNNVNNLEWCTTEYNCNYGTRNKKISEKARRAPIEQYDLKGNFIKAYDSIRDAATELNIGETSIAAALSGRCKTGKGFIWKRKETT